MVPHGAAQVESFISVAKVVAPDQHASGSPAHESKQDPIKDTAKPRKVVIDVHCASASASEIPPSPSPSSTATVKKMKAGDFVQILMAKKADFHQHRGRILLFKGSRTIRYQVAMLTSPRKNLEKDFAAQNVQPWQEPLSEDARQRRQP